MTPAPRVFTIPASTPFVPTLIRALIDGTLVPGFPATRDPLALAGATLYLPTRRACRLARDLFLDVTKESAAILPRIVAIGDVDEDEIAFAEAATGALAAEALALPPALGGLERRLLLARLVLRWAAQIAPDARGEAALVANNPASALALADDLARLMDDMTTREVPWRQLDGLVPDEFDEYWQLTLRFLQIARKNWPQVLDEIGSIDPAARRDALIKAEAARLSRKSDGPVIVAGSTGSIPATADLIATVARLPHGAVVLPGLDTDLDEHSWRPIGGSEKSGVAAAPGHPQFAMAALLSRIGIGRDAVAALTPARGRERLISEALRPADATDRWRHNTSDAAFAAQIDAALSKLTMIEAAHPEEEALAIAVALREAVAESKTAALVTPDRRLARRVAAALGRWDIAAEDSGVDALADTPAGIFARLAAIAALDGTPPVSLQALLKHPLLRLDFGRRDRAISALERAILRGPRPRPETGGLAGALENFRSQLERLRRHESSELHPSEPRTALTDGDLADAAELVRRLTAALAPLEAMDDGSQPLAECASRHRTVLAALSEDNGSEAGSCGVKAGGHRVNTEGLFADEQLQLNLRVFAR